MKLIRFIAAAILLTCGANANPPVQNGEVVKSTSSVPIHLETTTRSRQCEGLLPATRLTDCPPDFNATGGLKFQETGTFDCTNDVWTWSDPNDVSKNSQCYKNDSVSCPAGYTGTITRQVFINGVIVIKTDTCYRDVTSTCGKGYKGSIVTRQYHNGAASREISNTCECTPPLPQSFNTWDSNKISIDTYWKSSGSEDYYVGYVAKPKHDWFAAVGAWNTNSCKWTKSKRCKYGDQRECQQGYLSGTSSVSGKFPNGPGKSYCKGTDGCN
jgi:hypothetical protein